MSDDNGRREDRPVASRETPVKRTRSATGSVDLPTPAVKRKRSAPIEREASFESNTTAARSRKGKGRASRAKATPLPPQPTTHLRKRPVGFNDEEDEDEDSVATFGPAPKRRMVEGEQSSSSSTPTEVTLVAATPHDGTEQSASGSKQSASDSEQSDSGSAPKPALKVRNIRAVTRRTTAQGVAAGGGGGGDAGGGGGDFGDVGGAMVSRRQEVVQGPVCVGALQRGSQSSDGGSSQANLASEPVPSQHVVPPGETVGLLLPRPPSAHPSPSASHTLVAQARSQGHIVLSGRSGNAPSITLPEEASGEEHRAAASSAPAEPSRTMGDVPGLSSGGPLVGPPGVGPPGVTPPGVTSVVQPARVSGPPPSAHGGTPTSSSGPSSTLSQDTHPAPPIETPPTPPRDPPGTRLRPGRQVSRGGPPLNRPMRPRQCARGPPSLRANYGTSSDPHVAGPQSLMDSRPHSVLPPPLPPSPPPSSPPPLPPPSRSAESQLQVPASYMLATPQPHPHPMVWVNTTLVPPPVIPGIYYTHPPLGHPQPSPAHGHQGTRHLAQPFQGHPSQGHPSQGHPSQGHASQGHPSQGHPSQGHPSQGHPSQGHPSQGHPSQGHPSQGHPSQGHPSQGHPSQGHPSQGHPSQGHPSQSHPFQMPPSSVVHWVNRPNPQTGQRDTVLFGQAHHDAWGRGDAPRTHRQSGDPILWGEELDETVATEMVPRSGGLQSERQRGNALRGPARVSGQEEGRGGRRSNRRQGGGAEERQTRSSRGEPSSDGTARQGNASVTPTLPGERRLWLQERALEIGSRGEEESRQHVDGRRPPGETPMALPLYLTGDNHLPYIPLLRVVSADRLRPPQPDHAHPLQQRHGPHQDTSAPHRHDGSPRHGGGPSSGGPFLNAAASGTSTASPSGPGHSAAGPSGPGHSAAGPSGPGHSSAGPSGPGHSAAGPSGPGHSAAGPSGPGHSAAGPSGPGHSAAGPSGPGHSSAGPSGPGRSVAGPSGPGHSAAGPSGPGHSVAGPSGPGSSPASPSGHTAAARANVEVIVVDDVSSDEEVLTPHRRRRNRRRQHRRENTQHLTLPPPHYDVDDEVHMIRDNYSALATRISQWTHEDARRVLQAAAHATPTRPRTTEEWMNATAGMAPEVLYRVIIGPYVSVPAGVLSGGGSYEELIELAERLGPGGPQGIAQEAIDSIPIRSYSRVPSDKPSRCVVCMNDFENEDRVRSLPCTHEFHQPCIDQWLENHRSCPLCRGEVVPGLVTSVAF